MANTQEPAVSFTRAELQMLENACMLAAQVSCDHGQPEHGSKFQALVRKVRELEPNDLCPVCGEEITIRGWSTDGRVIGSCGDAFKP